MLPPASECAFNAAAVSARQPPRTVVAETPGPHWLTRAARGGARHIRHWLWRRRLAELGRHSDIHWPAYVVGDGAIALGEQVTIWHHARLEAFNTCPGVVRIAIGDGSAIQPYVHIGAVDSVRIGRGVLVASFVYISDHDHDWADPGDPVIENPRVCAAPVEIGDYVWLGERVIVLKGVAVGAHSVIGAASVVTHDIPPYAVAVGAPARVIRRYDQRTGAWQRVRS
jgi:acetyltransferase-like isoleucine patch superfamily enzyme